jgi:TonB family protein
VLLGHPLSVLDIKTPRIDFTVDRNVNAAMAAPVLDSDAPVDSSIFVQRAALSPGEGATVVFRIEVLEDGSAGQITIDVSSGSAQIDEAALEFARAHRWIPAVVAGIPKAMWIRWSVRLQA